MHLGIKIHPTGPGCLKNHGPGVIPQRSCRNGKPGLGGHSSPKLIRSGYCRARIINCFASGAFDGEPCVKKLLYADEDGRQKTFVAAIHPLGLASLCTYALSGVLFVVALPSFFSRIPLS